MHEFDQSLRPFAFGLMKKWTNFIFTQTVMDDASKFDMPTHQEDCIICRSSQSDTRCKHCLHSEYCLECLVKCATCPLCRHPLAIQDLEYKSGEPIPADVVEYLRLTDKVICTANDANDDVSLKKPTTETTKRKNPVWPSNQFVRKIARIPNAKKRVSAFKRHVWFYRDNLTDSDSDSGEW